MLFLKKLRQKVLAKINYKLKLVNLNFLAETKGSKFRGSFICEKSKLGVYNSITNSNLTVSHIGNSNYINSTTCYGNINIGNNIRLHRCDLKGSISINDYTSLWGPNLDISANLSTVKIGKFCSIARNVSIQTFNHNYKKMTTYFIGQNLFNEKWSNERVSKGHIEIKNDVWIGAHCIILGGVTINNGAIIAANSVVTSNVPAFSIVAGSPAKVIRYRFEKEVINRLEKLEWWDWSTEKIEKNKFLFKEEVSIDSLYKINN